jgi:molybdopterin converting factor subunit 1
VVDPDLAAAPAAARAVQVLYFAALRDLSGTNEERVRLPETKVDVTGLLALLQERHEALRGRLDSVRVAVDEEFTELSRELRGGEVVALIPPVSGG